MNTIKIANTFLKSTFLCHKIYRKFGLLTCLFILVLTETTFAQTVGNYAQSDQAGNTEVQASVDANGSAVIQIPIQLPPGTLGMQPQLTLTYNSSLGNGDLGVGWQIQGLSTIQRTGQTMAQDDTISSVNYSGTDRLMLDGQRLIQKSGSSYGLTNSKYRTEIETWQNVVCNENISSATSSFTVNAPNGITKIYGNTNSSRILAKGKSKVRVWALNKVEDLHGNYIIISYDNYDSTSGDYYPAEIKYTGNTKTSAPTKRSVKFQWEDRSDVYKTYMGGASIKQTKRLAYIRTYVNDVLIKEYHITYQAEDYNTTGRSLVDQITEKDGKETALPSTTFNWLRGSKIALADTMWGNTSYDVSNNGKAQWMVDMNGDGRQDLVYNRSGKFGYYVMLSNDNSFGTEEFWGDRNHSVAYDGNSQWMADLNGDGMADHVYNRDDENGYYVMLSEADTFGVDTYWGNKDHGVENKGDLQWFVDLNGDGMDDHIFQRDGTDDGDIIYYVRLSMGTTFASEQKWGSVSNKIANDNNNQWMADMNGDGRADHVYIEHDSYATYVMLSEGSKFGSDTYWGASLNDPSTSWFVDMNNDGLTDQVIQNGNQYSVRLNTGTTLNTENSWGTTSYSSEYGVESIWFVDVNGDQLPDLLYQRESSDYENQYYVSINTGSSFLADVIWGTKKKDVNEKGASQWFADMNGDGLADHIYNEEGNNVYYTMLAHGPYPDLLQSVVNSMGGETIFNYAKLGDQSVYSANTPGYVYSTNKGLTIADVKGGTMYVTKTMRFTNDAAHNNQAYDYKYEYIYKGAKIDHSGRGWLGFALKETHDLQIGNKQVEQYNQLFPYTGTIYSTTLMCYNSDDPNCTNGAKLQQQRTQYYCLDGPCSDSDKEKYVTEYEGGSVYQTLKSKDTERHYVYGDFNYGITNTYQYDDYGNQTLTAYLGYTDNNNNDINSDDNLNYYTDYYNNTSSNNWLIGYDTLSKVVSTDADNTVFSLTATQYDFPAKVSSTPSSMAGWQYEGTMDTVCVSYWVDTDNAGGTDYRIYRMTLHDAYGNPTVKIGPANDSLKMEYETDFNTFTKKTTMPPNKQGVKLVKTSTYDAGFGIETSSTDVNGFTSATVLDGFGRTVAITGPNAQNPDGPPDTLQTMVYHNSNGDQYITTHYLLEWGSDNYHRVHEYYDGLQRVYRKESISGASSKDVRIDYTFKDPQKQTGESLPYFDDGKAPVYWKKRGYDAYGRVNKVKEPFSDESGSKQTVTTIDYLIYDNIKSTTSSPDNDSTRVEVVSMQWYNGAQQVRKVIVPGDNNATTNYEYDRLGRIKYAKDADGVENTTTWNSLSNKLQFDETNAGTTVYKYDNTGLLKSVKDAKQQKQVFTYDLLNRKTSQTLYDASGAEVRKVVFTYDENATDTANAKGQLSSVKVSLPDNFTQSAYTYGYSPYGLLNSEELSFAGDNYLTQKAYSPLGTITEYIYPDASVLKVKGKYAGNLGSLSLKNHNTNDEITAKFSNYNAQDQVGLMTYGNGTTTTYQYMKDGVLKNALLKKGSNTIMQHGFTWNYLKELLQIADQHVDSVDYSQTFTYTNRRLTKAVSNTYGTLKYGYSKGGNMTSFEGKTFTYNGHQPDSTDNYLAKYDANGNMKSKSDGDVNYSYKYDTQNRLIAVYKNNAQSPYETYIYDYLGRRLQKTNNTTNKTTTYISPAYEKVKEAGNTTITKYVMGPAGKIGSIAVLSDQSVTLQYYHHDQINSTNLVSDAAGNVITHLVYQPYGKLYSSASFGEGNVQFSYEDKELDATGLYYFNARYFDPSSGRFITADTDLGANLYRSDTFNRYAFNLNDPIDYTDPSGHSSDDNRGKAVGGLFISGAEIAIGAMLLSAAPECPVCAVVGGAIIGMGTSSGGYSVSGVITGKFSWEIYGLTAAAGAIGNGLFSWYDLPETEEAVSFAEAKFDKEKFDKNAKRAYFGVAVVAGLRTTLTVGRYLINGDSSSDSNSNSSSDSNSNNSASSAKQSNEKQQKKAFENNVTLPKSNQ
ncbi:MAG: SpvB/TcaC N-terminal domain-containing protein [Bacteroidota bacterium]